MNQDATRAAQVAACVVVHTFSEELELLLGFLSEHPDRPGEIVVCLNSDDGELAARLRDHPAIDKLLVHPSNPGFSGGVNACFAATDQPFVWVLNPDVHPASDYLSLCLQVMDDEPQCGAVGGLLLRCDGEGGGIIDSAGFVMQPWWRIVDRASGAADTGSFQVREPVMGLCGASLLIRRSAAVAAADSGGVFDADFWMYKEDQDFCLRLSKHGFVCMFEPAARCAHGRGWQRGGRSGVPLVLRQHSLKNRYLLLAKHLHPLRDLFHLPAILIFEAILFVRLLLLEPRTCAGYVMALRQLAGALRKRSEHRHGKSGNDNPVRPG